LKYPKNIGNPEPAKFLEKRAQNYYKKNRIDVCALTFAQENSLQTVLHGEEKSHLFIQPKPGS
jgi:hypothetical protein